MIQSFFLKFNQDAFEGGVAMLLLLVFFCGVIVWYMLIEKPKEKKEFNNWLTENNKSLNLKTEIKNILSQLSDQAPPCDKCSNIEFQIWEINSEMVIRCLSCKKKKGWSFDTLEDMKFIFDRYIGFYYEMNSTQNALIKDYLSKNLFWAFESVRKGTSMYSVFNFQALGDATIIGESNNTIANSRRITQKVKDQVWKRDEGKCVECGSNENLEFDHIIPHSKGGANTYRNIQLLCQPCNRVKSDKIG